MRLFRINKPKSGDVLTILFFGTILQFLNNIATALIAKWGLHEVFGLTLSFKDAFILAIVIWVLTDHS